VRGGHVEIYTFRDNAVAGLISVFVHTALEELLNYAWNHLAELRCVPFNEGNEECSRRRQRDGETMTASVRSG
jgi:hypothetical protein